MKTVEFIEINDVMQKDFHEALSIYVSSLPLVERQTNKSIRERVATGRERVFIGRSQGEVVFMSLIWPLRGTDFILFDYMAVKEAYRNKGIGTQFVKNIFQISGIKDKRFILEVEDPRFGKDREMKRRRVEFYRRNGAKVLKNVDYVLPPIQRDTPTRMIVMVLSPFHDTCFSGKMMKKIFTQIYKELYGRSQDDQFLNSFASCIPSTLQLS